MRTFVALELPDQFIAETAAMTRALSQRIKGRPMKPNSYHITLAFLGDVDATAVDRAIVAMECACKEIPPIELRPVEIGKFGKPRDATIWLGLRQTEELANLAQRIRDELTAEGVEFDNKPFRPHITIMRRAFIPKGPLPEIPFPAEATVTRVTLFKSTLEPSGAVYDEIHTCELG